MNPTPFDLSGALARARRVVALTGAGVSAESGVPTFRGTNGIWNGQSVQNLASPSGFDADPVSVWEFYDSRRAHLLGCRPNAAHLALAQLERGLPQFQLITQNVDGLHQLAGSRPITLHGSIWIVRCVECGRETEDRRVPLPRPLPPRCDCGGTIRPAVVWFGESLPFAAISAAARAAEQCDLFLLIGTSGVVEPAASLARSAARSGATVVEFNLEETALTYCAGHQFLGPVAETLPPVVTPLFS